MADETTPVRNNVSYGFKPQANGTVTLIFSAPGKDPTELTIPVSELASFTAAALHSARLASKLSATVPQDLQKIAGNLPGARPDRIGVALGPAADQVSMVAHFGAAVLALPFSKGQAEQIGQALLATGASSKSSAQ